VGKKAAGFKPEFWDTVREFRDTYNRKQAVPGSIQDSKHSAFPAQFQGETTSNQQRLYLYNKNNYRWKDYLYIYQNKQPANWNPD
jgi:hypothetical protein